ncbi:bifunctional pyr operon transcriptional regulator/uracil phosphoribosyltransferase PyrR [Thiohalophilus sp.]|uniref:bifunctional pyr operon transcriptional regulator/uracil phosphoribosyltransferase PyrR n=1 Tax=Thiohalophilus sp. TaxID=3028392 RepID=UPI003A0FCB5E
MAGNLQSLLDSRHISDPAIIGIHTGGAWIAEQIHQQLRPEQPLGTLNITFYRDDFTRIGLHPQVEPSNLPFSVDDRHIVLVDDVLHTGRTIRAAMNEIFDYGRPASIILAVLVERSGRELPVCAEVAGERLNLAAHQHVKLTGPDPLVLLIQESK